MGYLSALDMAAHTDRATALQWHLQSNHYPPVPLAMLPACEAAIEAAKDDEPYRLIDLPDGVTYRGYSQANAATIIQSYHLDAFLADED